MGKIDEKTSVPLWWVWFIIIPIVGWTIVASTWVTRVDDRLSRIEDKLGIRSEVASGPELIQSAHAKYK